MKNRLISGLLVLTMIAALLMGCSKEPKKSPSSEAPETPAYQEFLNAINPFAYSNVDDLKLEAGSYISVIGRGSGGAFWDTVKKGAEQAIADINEKNGFTGKDKVRVVYSGPSVTGDVDQQINIFDEELARYPIAIAISVADVHSFEVQFDLAGENNVPLVTFDAGSEYHNIRAHVGIDNGAAAIQAAEAMAPELPEAPVEEAVEIVEDIPLGSAGETEAEGEAEAEKAESNATKVLIISGNTGAKTDLEREKAFKAKLQELRPDVEFIDTFQMAEGNQEHQDKLQELLEKEQPAGIFITANYLKSPVLKIYEDQTKFSEYPLIIGFDGTTTELKNLEEEKLFGLILQNPFGMGYASVVAAARAGLDLPNEAFVDTGFALVTAADAKSASSYIYAD
ncbi:ribose transport system substrate-binding protein [Lachnospiraceae bacterium PF1-21]|uniref:substrate-binding domain-containing protein n=1 Tax=Ohessyouella blattaphilus TaxID=2949333 RepID=UPI003E1EEC53